MITKLKSFRYTTKISLKIFNIFLSSSPFYNGIKTLKCTQNKPGDIWCSQTRCAKWKLQQDLKFRFTHLDEIQHVNVIQSVATTFVHHLLASTTTFKPFWLFQCTWHPNMIPYPSSITDWSHRNSQIYSQ